VGRSSFAGFRLLKRPKAAIEASAAERLKDLPGLGAEMLQELDCAAFHTKRRHRLLGAKPVICTGKAPCTEIYRPNRAAPLSMQSSGEIKLSETR
jgi:hypothetical protein